MRIEGWLETKRRKLLLPALALAVGLSACGGTVNRGVQAGLTSYGPAAATATTMVSHPAYSKLGLAMLAPGDQLTATVDTFGTLHFELTDLGAVATVTKAAALHVIPDDLMPDKMQNAYAKLATWVDDSQALLQPSTGRVRRLLVWLVVEPSMPGALPSGAGALPSGAGALPSGACCPSAADREKQTQYYLNWPIDIVAMVDATTGLVINGVMQYGVQ